MPIWMIVPSLSDVLDTLDEGLANLWLGCKLGSRHFCDIGCNAYELVEGSHDRINGVINKNA